MRRSRSTWQLWATERARSVVAVGGAFLVVLAIGTLGWMLLRPDVRAGAAAAFLPPIGATASPTGTTAPAPSGAPSPTPSPTAKPSPPRRAVPKPTQKPPAAQLPPPPPAPVSESLSCTQHPGPDASPSEVSAALVAAGAKQHWVGVQLPAGLAPPPPVITVPASLMKAVAWAESSWRSTIIACDGGTGLMQVMDYNEDFVNGRFGTQYDRTKMPDNVAIGATYLEWLTMYFGLYYFGTFDLAATAPVGDGGATMRLRDVVIAAYNVGHRAVENEHGTPEGGDDTLSIPNQSYVDRVTAYLTNCPCSTM